MSAIWSLSTRGQPLDFQPLTSAPMSDVPLSQLSQQPAPIKYAGYAIFAPNWTGQKGNRQRASRAGCTPLSLTVFVPRWHVRGASYLIETFPTARPILDKHLPT